MFAAVTALAALVISAVVAAYTIRDFQLRARNQRAADERKKQDELVEERVRDALEKARVEGIDRRLEELEQARKRKERDDSAP